MCSDKCISHMFCCLLSACMSCTGGQDTRSVQVQIELLLQMRGGLVHCSHSDKSQSSSRSLNRATEDYLVRTIWLYRSSLYGGDVVTVTVIALFTLSVWHSLSSPALCHAAISALSLCGLTSRGKAKELDVDSWGADSTETQGPLVDLVWVWMCRCVCMYVTVHMLGSDPTNDVFAAAEKTSETD